jgi:hypothetical protein
MFIVSVAVVEACALSHFLHHHITQPLMCACRVTMKMIGDLAARLYDANLAGTQRFSESALLLQHDVFADSIDLVADIIDQLTPLGMQFARVDNCYTELGAGTVPPTTAVTLTTPPQVFTAAACLYGCIGAANDPAITITVTGEK